MTKPGTIRWNGSPSKKPLSARCLNEPPGASGSQWFVVTAEDAQLPPDYALLGKVTEGLDVVDKIGAVPTTPDEQPADPVVIRSVKVSGP